MRMCHYACTGAVESARRAAGRSGSDASSARSTIGWLRVSRSHQKRRWSLRECRLGPATEWGGRADPAVRAALHHSETSLVKGQRAIASSRAPVTPAAHGRPLTELAWSRCASGPATGSAASPIARPRVVGSAPTSLLGRRPPGREPLDWGRTLGLAASAYSGRKTRDDCVAWQGRRRLRRHPGWFTTATPGCQFTPSSGEVTDCYSCRCYCPGLHCAGRIGHRRRYGWVALSAESAADEQQLSDS